ncbi:MAG: WYL domain-containing protein [Nakamurella sp.]
MDRVTRMLDLLRARERMTTGELAERLGASERTVRRDLGQLSERGVEVAVTPGRQGGVRLVRDPSLPALRFTDEEALALALALGAAAGDSRLAAAAATARTRLSRVLSDKYGAALASLADVVAAQKISLLGDDPVADAQLLTLALATARRHHVQIDYRGPNGTATRPLDPYGVVPMAGHWYVTGFCGLRRAVRTFRIDRITRVHETDLRIVVPPDFDAQSTVATGIRGSGTATLRCEVLFLAAAQDVRALAPAHRMEILPAPAGTSAPAVLGVIRAEPRHLRTVALMLLGADLPLEIIGPDALRQALSAVAHDASVLADGRFPADSC